jgi:hypothetical protein
MRTPIAEPFPPAAGVPLSAVKQALLGYQFCHVIQPRQLERFA